MKKILLVAVAFVLTIAVQAQEKTVKDLYVQDGNLVKATLHHENGMVSQKGTFDQNGKLTGKWISYDREGNKTAEAHYEAGEKVGTWFFWTDDILSEVNYNNSRIATVNTWKNEDTQVVSNR